jgi:hypothetical protein
MSDPPNPNPNPDLPADVSLLLRAHAEQQWLSGEVIPVVRQIETCERQPETPARPLDSGGRASEAGAYRSEVPGGLCETGEPLGEICERLPEDQVPAAVAYLEVVWVEALSRARETEGARRRFEDSGRPDWALPAKARRYHDAVRVLREAVARRVARLLAVPAETLIDRGTPGAWGGALHNLTH